MKTGAYIRFGFVAVVLGASFAPSLAYETGFSNMHSQARVGNKMCMTDHTHYGNGTGATQAAAQREAIASWQSFTDFEYGSAWASFRNAAARGQSCSRGGGNISCSVEARPCRLMRAARKK